MTLAWATERATPARNPVRPARAPLDRSRPASGIFTEPEVMLTIRPNRRSTMPSTTCCTSSIGVAMFATTPASSASRSTARKSRNGGPPLLLTRMSTCGTAADQGRPGRRLSRHPRRWRSPSRPSRRGSRRRSAPAPRLAAVDDDDAARPRELERAGASEPPARRADDGEPPFEAEIHRETLFTAPDVARDASRWHQPAPETSPSASPDGSAPSSQCRLARCIRLAQGMACARHGGR